MAASTGRVGRFSALVLAGMCSAAWALPYAPRFQTLQAPPFLGDDAAEPSIAFNPESRLGLFQSGIHTLRYVLPEYRADDALNPAGLPEACDTLWQDVTPPNGPTTTLDPIGLGDPIAGRYFASQMAVRSSALNFTDDDGVTWTSSVGGFPGGSGIDHQTVGWGPYVAGGLARPLAEYPHAIYYCAQDSDELQRTGGEAGPRETAGYTNCSRSDDGGLSFLPPVTVHTTVDCGGLQGHVRAAPDGTVYLPNKNCITNQGMGVSEDNGVTWTVRRVPTSTPGTTDPQIALATDGTGYFCYVNGDGHPHVAVTRDKGQHWLNDTDLGLPVGVVTAVFPQGIAGDPDRAACGFIGTATPGNSEGEDFTGVWYPYVAVTYDGGLTWSVTNTSPEDPSQGAGGICTRGIDCSGSNRNLLDFNDMTIDDRGRPLMGFADGCVGTCVWNPSAPTRAAKASITRAVGGKSLYATLDRAEPHAPQAACLAGERSEDMATLSWRPPADDGRSAVTGYRIYRSTSPAAAGNLIASTGAGRAFTDPGADAAVPDYYYTVIAVNGAGASVHSNRIRLSVGGGAGTESVCVSPGLTLLDDPEGDADSNAAHDVVRLSIAQPSSSAGDYRIHFGLKMAGLDALTANTTWPVSFCAPAFPCTDPGVAYGPDNQYYTVEMSTAPPASTAAPAFLVRQPTGGPTLDTRAVVPASTDSAYAPSGLITIVVDAADLGLQAADAGVDSLAGFLSGIGVSNAVGGVSVSATVDQMPDDGAGAGQYLTRTVDACIPDTPPVAVLSADPGSGLAPLAVSFDGGASTDAEGAIAEFTFDFGDGSAPVTQSTAVIAHTYEQVGSYDATLRVKDARGLVSAAAVATIRVGVEPKDGNNYMGGGALPAGLLVLGLLAALARKHARAWSSTTPTACR